MSQGPQGQMRGYSEPLPTSPTPQARVPGNSTSPTAPKEEQSSRASEQGFAWLCLGPRHTARKGTRQGLFLLRASGYHQLRVAGQLTEPV